MAEQVGAGGVQEVVLPQLRGGVEGVEEVEASIRALAKSTAIARLRSTMGVGWRRGGPARLGRDLFEREREGTRVDTRFEIRGVNRGR